ncbi:hypothetical protein CC80DRAFT_510000 [Byssothecium circinans]|uniref:Uncharacterized protein n=1 Tax=Byssothecium circinans TaxID=147558 RepID=A0A6A5TM42_9PLEO|nr:hypothetical protein CC80DRAFT_510000 [Byssothecium circinans]
MSHQSEDGKKAHCSVQGETATGAMVKGGHVPEDPSKQTRASQVVRYSRIYAHSLIRGRDRSLACVTVVLENNHRSLFTREIFTHFPYKANIIQWLLRRSPPLLLNLWESISLEHGAINSKNVRKQSCSEGIAIERDWLGIGWIKHAIIKDLKIYTVHVNRVFGIYKKINNAMDRQNTLVAFRIQSFPLAVPIPEFQGQYAHRNGEAKGIGAVGGFSSWVPFSCHSLEPSSVLIDDSRSIQRPFLSFSPKPYQSFESVFEKSFCDSLIIGVELGIIDNGFYAVGERKQQTPRE